jgi:hypothetical protein
MEGCAMIELRPGEQLLEDVHVLYDPGSRFREEWLFVTNQRLFVYPPYRGFPGDFHEISIGSIDYLYPFNVYRILPLGIAIVLKSGETLCIGVFRRDRLMAAIRGAAADFARAHGYR